MNVHFKFDLGIIGTSIWLTIILAILKIANILDISIWWVLSPIFLAFGLTTVLICVLFTLLINNLNNIVDEVENDEESQEE